MQGLLVVADFCFTWLGADVLFVPLEVRLSWDNRSYQVLVSFVYWVEEAASSSCWKFLYSLLIYNVHRRIQFELLLRDSPKLKRINAIEIYTRRLNKARILAHFLSILYRWGNMKNFNLFHCHFSLTKCRSISKFFVLWCFTWFVDKYSELICYHKTPTLMYLRGQCSTSNDGLHKKQISTTAFAIPQYSAGPRWYCLLMLWRPWD